MIIEDIEKFTIESVNKISLTILEDSQLQKKYLDNFILFILVSFKDEADCLSKLKVLDREKLNQIDGVDVVSHIFLTILSIKGIELIDEDIEYTSLYLLTKYDKRVFNKTVQWYFRRKGASERFPKNICATIFKIKNISCIKEVDRSDREDSEDEMYSISSDIPEEENPNPILGLLAHRKKDRDVKNELTLKRLIMLLKIISKKNRSNIKDFYAIVTLLRIKNRNISSIVHSYLTNLKDDPELEELFFSGLRLSSRAISMFPKIYKKTTGFNWNKFIDILKNRNRIDLTYLKFVKMPPDILNRVINEVKMSECVLKSQIKKISDLDELKLLKALMKNQRAQNAINSRIEYLNSVSSKYL